LAIQDDYRSDGSDLIREFYIPCLENSTVHERDEYDLDPHNSVLVVSRNALKQNVALDKVTETVDGVIVNGKNFFDNFDLDKEEV
jgi:hypothetical protein